MIWHGVCISFCVYTHKQVTTMMACLMVVLFIDYGQENGNSCSSQLVERSLSLWERYQTVIVTSPIQTSRKSPPLLWRNALQGRYPLPYSEQYLTSFLVLMWLQCSYYCSVSSLQLLAWCERSSSKREVLGSMPGAHLINFFFF